MTTQAAAPSSRVASLDVLRGAIMVLMAIDHVRVYSGVPPGGPDPAVFFTRWITHFCAPGFVFFAGTAAYLHWQKLGSRGAASRWLLLRGAWLILLELTLMRLSWTFNLDFQHYLLAGVLWAIGWCMIALAALLWLPARAVGVIGLAIIALHNLTDHTGRLPQSALLKVVYLGGEIGPLKILYVLIPWIGVMAAGWGFGEIVRMTPERRTRLCLSIGAGAIALFVLLRATALYGDPRAVETAGPPEMPAALRFLNTTKYPASLQFLLMTLGPLIAMVPIVRGGKVLSVFGRAPLFYYVLHIPLIHALALIVSRLREGRVNPWLFENHPFRASWAPPGYAWGLPLLYLVTAIAVALLYLPCRWYAERKAQSRSVLLSLL